MVVLLGTTIDALWTTIWVDGHAGPITGRHTALTRRVMLLLAGRHHRRLSLTGPLVLVSTVLTWALLVWVGWVAIFSAGDPSLVRAHGGQPANLADRIYFAGSTLFTLGNGDFTPHGGQWEIATALASLSGLFFITLAVTYVLAVIEAVVAKRSFASQVSAIGKSPAEFVLNSWNGSAFPSVDLQIVSLTEQLNLVTEQHTAYPLLHYYHESRTRQSVPVGLTIFAEALSIFERAVAKEFRPAPVALQCARESIHDFLQTLKNAYIDPAEKHVPPPELDRLRQAGIPLVPEEAFEASLRDIDEDRRLLQGFLDGERRQWPGRRD